MQIGKTYKFKITAKVDNGHYLEPVEDNGEKEQDIFMPYLRKDKKRSMDLKVDDEVEAFIYQSEDGQLIASLNLPCVLGENT